MLLVVAVVVGALAGVVRHPAGARTARPSLHRSWLLLVGAGGHVASTLVDGEAATLALGASLAALAAFAGSNLHLTGVAVVGVGVVVNLSALLLNNGMPVRPEALVRAEIVTEAELATVEVAAPRHLETDADRFAILGDVLPVPVVRTVLSFGDLIVLFGLADALRDVARRHRRRWTENERRAYRARTIQPSVVQDWGRAPSPVPRSGSQCSAQPEATAPRASDPASDAATDPPPAAGGELVAASHSR